VESPDDQVYSKQTRSIKQSKNKKENKSRTPGIERLIPDNGAKDFQFFKLVRQQQHQINTLLHKYENTTNK
jgi:hypothetical protein